MKLIAILICAAAFLPAAPIQVSIDTSSLNTQAGTIDIQFNPGGPSGSYAAATVEILDFVVGGGILGSIAFGPDGGVTGMLPDLMTILNSAALNGVTLDAIFGTTISFLVNFSGDGFALPGQSVLTSLYVGLNGTSNTLVVQADLIGDGQLDTSFTSGEVSFQPVASDVPEPATCGLIGLGLAALLLRRRVS